jgi:hypothetical protein
MHVKENEPVNNSMYNHSFYFLCLKRQKNRVIEFTKTNYLNNKNNTNNSLYNIFESKEKTINFKAA